MVTNRESLGAVMESQNAANEAAERKRLKAEADYFAIIKDPTRTSDEDKKLLAAAMKTLGKSQAQAIADVNAIDKAHELAEGAKDRMAAAVAHEKAEAELLHFHQVTKLKMQAEIVNLRREKELAANAALQRLNDAKTGLARLLHHRNLHPHLVEHFPKEGEGIKHVSINRGLSYGGRAETI